MRAAAMGHAWASANAARLLEERGDLPRACSQYLHAAELGDADAQWGLAQRLQSGRTCPVDEGEARRWRVVAVQSGHPAALEALARLQEEG
eukprot:scaffold80000_cov48-Phaeocystis_antarctica.AAC.1